VTLPSLKSNSLTEVQKNTPSSEQTTHLVTIVGPGAELHGAALLIEGKILDINLTGGLVDSWRLPEHFSVEVEGRLRHQCHLIIPVRATNKPQFKFVHYTSLDNEFN
jgi:hypothetical protein